MSLLLSGLIVVPAQAMAAEIPFFVTNEDARSWWLQCDGPWLRRSSACPLRIRSGTRNEHFYSAEETLFSPYGLWICNLINEDHCSIIIPFNRRVEFCVHERTPPVELTITASGFEVNRSHAPCTVAAAAGFLGDASSPGRDRDIFRFDGETGETITVTLEPDGASGGGGEIARLILREDGGRRLDTDTGALPLKLTATLPAAGSYAVEALEVGRVGADASSAFRGHFLLRVESDAGETRGESLLLEPTERTEP